MAVDFQDEGLCSQVVHEFLRHFDSDVLDVVEADGHPCAAIAIAVASSLSRVVPDRLSGERLVLMVDKVELAEDVAIVNWDVNGVQNGDAEGKIPPDNQMLRQSGLIRLLFLLVRLRPARPLLLIRAGFRIRCASFVALHLTLALHFPSWIGRTVGLAESGRVGSGFWERLFSAVRKGNAGGLLDAARIVSVFVVQDGLDSYSQVSADVALLVHDGHIVDQRDGIEQTAQLNESSTN